MSDDQTGQNDGQPDDKSGGGNYTPPASQADLDRIIAERVSRERGKYADYADLKAKAGKFDELAEAQKTELQKAVERAEAAEAKAAQYETEKQVADWRAEVATATGVPESALRGSTKEELEAHAETLKSLIPAQDVKKGAIGPYVPPEGAAPSGGSLGSTADKFAEAVQNAFL